MRAIARKVFVVIIMLTGAGVATAQVCPQGMVCLSQEAANVAASNAREVVALRQVKAELEGAIDLERKNSAEIKATAQKNEIDLRERIITTQVAHATAVGELVGARAEIVRLTAMNEFLNKNGRKKCGTLTLICVQ